MGANYEVWLSDQNGVRLALLQGWESLQWTRVENGVGQFALEFPREKFDRDLLWGVDRRVEVWRQPEGGTLQLLRVYFTRYLLQAESGESRIIVLKGPDANDLLERRIIAYDAASAEADKTATGADDMMKAYVDENLGGSAAAGRDITGFGFSIQANLTAGVAVDKQAARRNLLLVCQELAKASREQGTPLFFDVVDATPTTFQFRTYTGQRGIDRTWPDGLNPVILSTEMGNLRDPSYEQDWRDEWSFVYAAGQGEEAQREVVEVPDAARIAASIFNRREQLFDGRNNSDTDALTDGGNSRLREGIPLKRFQATLQDTPTFRYQLDWDFGDKLTAEYVGERFDVDVAAVMGTVDGLGGEVVQARLDNADQ